MITLQNYINGSLCNPIENNWLDNIEPATGTVYAKIPDSSQYDIDLAIEAAKSAKYSWANMSVEDRSAIMMKIADGIRNRFDEFAVAESKDQGKPLWLSKAMDITRAIQNIEFFATEILHFASESHHSSQTINYTL